MLAMVYECHPHLEILRVVTEYLKPEMADSPEVESDFELADSSNFELCEYLLFDDYMGEDQSAFFASGVAENLVHPVNEVDKSGISSSSLHERPARSKQMINTKILRFVYICILLTVFVLRVL